MCFCLVGYVLATQRHAEKYFIYCRLIKGYIKDKVCKNISAPQGMIGTGRASVSEVCDLARANISDGLPSEALAAFASLGSGGMHSANQKRDLHRWMHSLFGMDLTTYKVKMTLNAPCKN